MLVVIKYVLVEVLWLSVNSVNIEKLKEVLLSMKSFFFFFSYQKCLLGSVEVKKPFLAVVKKVHMYMYALSLVDA